MIAETHWLRTQLHTLFQMRRDGRIERENDPDCSPGPRFWLAGCADGNVYGVRADLSDEVAQTLADLAASEPPFLHPGTPRHLDRFLELLASDQPAKHELELTYDLAHAQPLPGNARLVSYDSGEGRELLQSWAAQVPTAWSELGFREVADFWPPWCAAVVDREVASIAFAARLSDSGAELGLVTAKPHRGRGLAAAATAGWSQLAALHSRSLFYSTARDNRPSQRVAARLGLRMIGTSLRIS